MGGVCTKSNEEYVPFMDSTSPRYHGFGRSGDQACCNCGPNGDCSDCKCSTHRFTFCQSQNCLFRKQIQNAIESMSEEQTRGALYMFMTVKGIENLNQAVFGEGIQPQVFIKDACPECKKYCKYVSKCIGETCSYRESVEEKIQNMIVNERKEALKTILDSNSLDKLADAVFGNVCYDKVPTWYCLRPCWNCQQNGNYPDCNCCRHRGTSCLNTNCKFREDIQDAIDSMRTEQTRDALNELMAVQRIANLNQAVLRNRFRRVYYTRACSKCQTSRKYDSACSDVACTYKKELEKAIQRMDADKGKTALNEVLKSNSLNKVEDAVFWNVCNDRVPEWYSEEITGVQEFKDKVTGLALLKVNKNHSPRPDKILHLIFRNSNDSNVTRICYEPFLGEFKLHARQYDLDDEDFSSFIDFKKESCIPIWHEQLMQSQQPQPTCNTTMTDNLKYIIGKIGTTENGDEFKVGEANKPEAHKLLKTMYKAAAEKNKKGLYCLLPFFKSIGVLVTLLISFIGVAFTSNVRQAHIRILVEMFIDFQKQQKYPHFVFSQCTSFYGKKVIHATHERVKEVIEEDYPKETSFVIALINNNISRFLDTDKVCGIASDLGKENMMKTSIDLLVIWSILQIAFILSYETLHLRSALKPYPSLYFKAIVIEVVGGFVPMIFSIGTGCIIQHEMDRPTVLYVTMVCVTAFVTSALFRFLLNLIPIKAFCGRCCKKCLNSKCKTGCVISLVLSISSILACMILMYLHHKSPKIFKYFDPL